MALARSWLRESLASWAVSQVCSSATRGALGLWTSARSRPTSWRDLPGARQGCWPRSVLPWPCILPRYHSRRAGRSRNGADRSGRMAYHGQNRGARQYQHHRAPRQMPRTQPRRKHLAVHARKLAAEPHLQTLRHIVDHCCDAWNKPVDQPWHIMTINRRK
jgi:hypothetical protein